jgi:hypothetical protein
MGKSDKPLTGWKEIDNLAVSKGEERVENFEEDLETTTTGTPGIPAIQGKKIKKPNEEELADKDEGGEVMVDNFPDRMQRHFTETKGEWMPWIMQWHLRGNKSVHTDLRMKVSEGILEGFTLFTPGNVDSEDLLSENPHNLRGTIKSQQPQEWLNVNGGFKSGEPGTTSSHNAYFAIVGKGTYRIIEVTDHKIVFELKSDSGSVQKMKPLIPEDAELVNHFNTKLPDNLKQLSGCFSYHIAHIEATRWIILFDKLKECPKGVPDV